MGNCFAHESAAVIVEDDTVYWEHTKNAASGVEKHKLIQSVILPSSKVVKIKISRKDFEAVMRGEEEDAFLSRLVSAADVTTVTSKTWRPVLYSIPETD